MAVADLREMARLASGDEARSRRLSSRWSFRYDPVHYALLQGLCTGEVYRGEGRRGAERIGDYR